MKEVNAENVKARIAHFEQQPTLSTNEQFTLDCLRRLLVSLSHSVTMGVGSGDGNLFVHGDYESIKAAQRIIFERDDWMRRALAAENHAADGWRAGHALTIECDNLKAQLDELAKQEPVAYILQDKLDRDAGRQGRVSFQPAEAWSPEDVNEYEISSEPLFTRPAPAVSLAELVPEEPIDSNAPDYLRADNARAWCIGANWMRSAILRNIEEDK